MKKHYRKKVTRKVSKGVKKYVKKEFDKLVEDKQEVVNIGTYNANNVADYIPLNLMPQGVDQAQRVGMSVRNKSLQLRISYGAAVGIVASQRIRFIVLWDRQASGALPTTNSLFASPLAGDTLLSPLKIESSDRYKILYDQIKCINIGGGATDAANRYSINKKWKLKTLTKYIGTTSNITSLNTNSLMFITCAQNATSVAVTVQADLRYEDA